MSVFARLLWAIALTFATTAESWAYGGPGAAITLIGSLVGVGLAIFASLFYVVAWPLRRMLKKRKPSGNEAAAQDGTAGEATVATGTVVEPAASSADAQAPRAG